MGFKKGNGHGKGRDKGSKNKKSLAKKEELEAMFHDEVGFKKLFETLKQITEPKDKFHATIKLMEFFMAKQKEIEIKGEDMPNYIANVTFTSTGIKPIESEQEMRNKDK